MDNLRLNGVAVRASFLTQRSYRAAYCDFLLPVTRRNKLAALAKFRRVGEFGPYSGLYISGVADLAFLSEFPNLLYLEIDDQKRVATDCLAGLANLRGLRLESPGAGIDFSWFPELEVFVGDWHIGNRNVDRCQELRTLRVWRFNPESHDLAPLAHVPRLEHLQITQTNIQSLAGVETLADLRYLDISHAPKLERLDPLAGVRPGNGPGIEPSIGIRELSISKAKAISSYRPLASISHLRRLKLTGCAPMPDLRWTQGMDHLDFFSFVDTDVKSGDLSPLLTLPSLRYVGTMDKKHYNYKCDRLNEMLGKKGAVAGT
jgi:hypothetical protein